MKCRCGAKTAWGRTQLTGAGLIKVKQDGCGGKIRPVRRKGGKTERWKKRTKDTDHDGDTDGKAASEFQFDLMSFLRTM